MKYIKETISYEVRPGQKVFCYTSMPFDDTLCESDMYENDWGVECTYKEEFTYTRRIVDIEI